MPTTTAQQCYSRGLAAMAEGHHTVAADLFREALRLDERGGPARRDMRFLSYYGLSLAQAHKATPAAINACEVAVQYEPGKPSLLLNLGRVYVIAGKTTQALSCFERGLALSPGHRSLQLALAAVDRRGKPMLPRLARSHPLNRWAGCVVAKWRSRSRGPLSKPIAAPR
jgi:tetratricopeptide (TPR) repeat protein